MNWKSVPYGVNDVVEDGGFNYNGYSCQDNRSCNVARDNNSTNLGNASQIYGCSIRRTIDVEDLGRCFEEQNSNNEGKIKNLYKRTPHVNHFNRNQGGNNERDKKIVYNYKDDDDDGGGGGVVSPSQRMWVNMKAAAFVDDDIITNNLTMNDEFFCNFSSNNEIKMAPTETKWQQFQSTEEQYYSKIPHTYFNQSADVSSWFYKDQENEKLKKTEESSYDIHQVFHDEGYYDNSITYYHPSLNQFENEQADNLKRFNLCSENQWLRCPVASQCPVFNDDYNFNVNQSNNNQTVLPCLDQSSELLFYYGQDIGYLTPAEFQRYEEDSL